MILMFGPSILGGSISKPYDPSNTSGSSSAPGYYEPGDYCSYNGKVWKCMAITYGTFDPADWEEIVITDEMGHGGGGGEYATDIPMSSSDSTSVYNAIGSKTDKVSGATSGNFASLDSNGNVQDSGSKASDFLTQHQDISGKADKVSSATNGNFASLDSNGNLTDSGHKHSDYITSHQDISGKADKVSHATSGNFAGLDSAGNLTDSGSKASDFLTSHQDISGKADKVSGATNGNLAGLDVNGNLTDSGKAPSDFMEEMTILSYGNSTWNDFITAYNTKRVVYCRASSNSNPASGSQTRLAFMAYVNNETSPTEVEFQYYRSISSHTASQQGDQVFVYKLTSAGAWTVTTREATIKVAAGTNLTSSFASNTLSINAEPMVGATSSHAGGAGVVPAPSTGDTEKFLRGDGTWAEVESGGTPVSEISFSIATGDWTASSGAFTAEVSSTAFTSGSKEIIRYTNSMQFLRSDISAEKDGTNHKMVFIVDALPTGIISGTILSFGDDGTYMSRLPDVTSADNGKVMRVVNGAWAAENLPTANGVSF